mmetsp:Transcript_22502/g.34697  ORF Transcript_22502/g.34697 Transcript_22502/m.34697 type:complete len:90 (+) Transcript_22502:790-1059(+)
MVRNPTKRANAKALIQHLDLIQEYNTQISMEQQGHHKKDEEEHDFPQISSSSSRSEVVSFTDDLTHDLNSDGTTTATTTTTTTRMDGSI